MDVAIGVGVAVMASVGVGATGCPLSSYVNVATTVLPTATFPDKANIPALRSHKLTAKDAPFTTTIGAENRGVTPGEMVS